MSLVEHEVAITEAEVNAINSLRMVRGQKPANLQPRKAGPLFKVLWFRIVLDEASGNIRNGDTLAARAVTKLHAARRWCLTGTPIENSIDDLFPLFRFLKMKCVMRGRAMRGYGLCINSFGHSSCPALLPRPPSHPLLLCFVLGRPYDDIRSFHNDFAQRRNGNINSVSMQRLRTVLEGVCLRRTKETRLEDGKRLLDLPDRNIMFLNAQFSPDEAAFYRAVELRMQLKFNAFVQKNKSTQNLVTHALELLLRMRQACLHPLLVSSERNQIERERRLMALNYRIEQIMTNNSDVGAGGATAQSGDGTQLVLDSDEEEDVEMLLPAVLSTGPVMSVTAAFAASGTASTSPKKRANAQSKIHLLRPGVLKRLQAQEDPAVCPICLDTPVRADALVAPCGHLLCRECVGLIPADRTECPTCRQGFKLDHMVPGEQVGEVEEEEEE